MSENLDQPNEQALTPQTSAGVPAMINRPILGRGHEEESDMEDIQPPHAKLIQFTSGEAKDPDKTRRIDPGTLINSISRQEIGKVFIPIYKFTNFAQWNPRKKEDPNFDPAFEPGELVFSTADRRDPRVIEGKVFGPNGEAPKVTKYLNFLCLFPGQNYPMILSFAKTSFKGGARLNTLTQMEGGDMFANKYELIIKLAGEENSEHFTMDVFPAGKASEEEFKAAEFWWNEFKGKTLKTPDVE